MFCFGSSSNGKYEIEDATNYETYKAQSQIGVTKAGTESGFSVETDMHFKGGNVIEDGRDREAFAATPISVGGQMAINGVIGGAQSAINGGSVKDVAVGVGTGVLVGKLGGQGYKPTLHFWKALYTKDAVSAVKGGMAWGMGVSTVSNFVNFGIGKVKGCFVNENKENLNAIPAR